ncbi:unnamed protein product [Ectocarpus sp. 12 AP-2014]
MAGQQPLRRLGLDEDLVSRLASEGLHTAGDMFSKTELQLVQSLDASREKVVELLDHVSRRIVPEQAKTAGDLLRERREAGASFFVATGIQPLDDALQGGFPTGMITELVGPAGIGKTQTCLQVAAQACLPAKLGGLGEDAGVLYLDTERKFSPDRLVEIASERHPGHYGEFSTEKGSMERLLNQVTVFPVDNSAALMDRLETLQARMIESNVRLIVLDSIAALARRDFAREDTLSRQELLTRQAAVLKSLAYTFSAVVLVTNQVTTSFYPTSGLQGGSRQSIASHTNSSSGEGKSASETEVSGGRGDSYIIPALGNTWHHCVSNRLILEQHDGHREMHLTKSPLAPAVSCRFVVRESGIEQVGV